MSRNFRAQKRNSSSIFFTILLSCLLSVCVSTVITSTIGTLQGLSGDVQTSDVNPCPCPYHIVLAKSLFSIDILPRTPIYILLAYH